MWLIKVHTSQEAPTSTSGSSSHIKGLAKSSTHRFFRRILDFPELYDKLESYAKVAKIHNKIRNKRKDFINKLSTKIINNHDIICIEDLNIKGMLKNHKLSKSISDVSWSEFVRQLEYKANWYGRNIVKVPTFYPSSKTCSSCGNIKETLKLSERIYHCKYCGLEIDRDYNASINILRKGLEILKEEKVS